MREWIEVLKGMLNDAAEPNVMVVTGAGISVASGIPTFRGPDPDAVWSKDVMEMGTVSFFQRDPVKSWQWYLSRFDGCRKADPNPAHTALADIERTLLAQGGNFTLVTQNVDGLHSRAGSQNVIEVHGSARHMRCSQRQCVNGAPRGLLDWDDTVFDQFRTEPVFKNLPRCPQCNKLVRAHVLWFDESYSDHESYGIDEVRNAVCDKPLTLMVFIGTSFAVTITDMLVDAALEDGTPMVVIDPHATDLPVEAMEHIKLPAEVFLPEVAESLARSEQTE
jgi:NAD-dependent deacetylase